MKKVFFFSLVFLIGCVSQQSQRVLPVKIDYSDSGLTGGYSSSQPLLGLKECNYCIDTPSTYPKLLSYRFIENNDDIKIMMRELTPTFTRKKYQ